MKRLGIPIASLLLLFTAPLVANADLRDQYESNDECHAIYKEEGVTISPSRFLYVVFCTFNGFVYDIDITHENGRRWFKRGRRRTALGEKRVYGNHGWVEQWFIEGSDLVKYKCESFNSISLECRRNVTKTRYPLYYYRTDL